MTKRDLIRALEQSSVEDWAPVMVETPDFPGRSEFNHDCEGIITTHTNKIQEILIRVLPITEASKSHGQHQLQR